MDERELKFLLTMRDEASAILSAHGNVVRQTASAHKEAGEAAKEHASGLHELVNKAKEAAEAVSAIWASSELNERTIGAYAELEVTMVRLQQTMGVTADQADELKDKLEGMAGASLNQTTDQLIAVATSAKQLGLAGESITSFTKNISELATVTGVSAGQLANAMGEILSATGETETGIHGASEAFAALSKETRGGADALLQSTETLAMMTSGMGLTAVQTLGLASSLDKLGVRTRAATMDIGAVLQEFRKIGTDTKMESTLRSMATSMGLTAEQFKEMQKTDPSALLVKFLGAVKNIKDSGQDVREFLQQFSLGGQSMETVFLAAAKNVDVFKQKAEEAKKAAGGTGMEDNYAELMKTLAADFHQLSVDAEAMGTSLGKAFAPGFGSMLHTLTGDITHLVDWFDKLSPSVKAVAADIIIGLPAFLAVQKAWSFLSEVIASGLGNFRRLPGVLGDAARAMTLFRVAGEDVAKAEGELEGASVGAEGGLNKLAVSTDLVAASARTAKTELKGMAAAAVEAEALASAPTVRLAVKAAPAAAAAAAEGASISAAGGVGAAAVGAAALGATAFGKRSAPSATSELDAAEVEKTATSGLAMRASLAEGRTALQKMGVEALAFAKNPSSGVGVMTAAGAG